MLDAVRLEANNLAELNFEYKSKLQIITPNDPIYEATLKKEDTSKILFPFQKQIKVNPSLEIDSPKLKGFNSGNKDLFRDQENILAEKSTDTLDLILVSVNECQTEEDEKKKEIKINQNIFNNSASQSSFFINKRDSNLEENIFDFEQNIKIDYEKNQNMINNSVSQNSINKRDSKIEKIINIIDFDKNNNNHEMDNEKNQNMVNNSVSQSSINKDDYKKEENIIDFGQNNKIYNEKNQNIFSQSSINKRDSKIEENFIDFEQNNEIYNEKNGNSICPFENNEKKVCSQERICPIMKKSKITYVIDFLQKYIIFICSYMNILSFF